MKTSLILIITFVSFLSIESCAQSTYDPITRVYFDKKELQKEIEQILNVIINSTQFDSIYSSEKVYLSEDAVPYFDSETPYVIKKNEKTILVKKDSILKKMEIPYVGIGNWVMPKQDPKSASIQVYSTLTNMFLNLRLEKKDDSWIIMNHVIFKE